MYNYNHLYYFFICAQFKSFSKAAVFLKTSQPSLSIQIKTLEEKLDLELFSRTGRSLELTSGGKIIFSFCEKMFAETQNITNYIKNKKTNQRENISIGVSEQIERPYIADIIGGLIKQYRKAEMPKIRMQTLSSNEMLSLLKMDKMDIVVTHERVNIKNIESFTLEVPVALVGLKKILKSNSSSRNKLKAFIGHYDGGLIVPIDSFKLRNETDIFFSKFTTSPDIIFESSNLSASIRAICDGLGVGFLPLIYILKEINSGKLAYLMPENGVWSHSFYIYSSKKSLEKKSIQEIVRLFQNSLKFELPKMETHS